MEHRCYCICRTETCVKHFQVHFFAPLICTYPALIKSKCTPRLNGVGGGWLVTMCSLCFAACRKLCIAEHPHFPTDSDTGILVTRGYFAHFCSDRQHPLASHVLPHVALWWIWLWFPKKLPLTDGCLCADAAPQPMTFKWNDAGLLGWNPVLRVLKIRPNQFWLLQSMKEKKNLQQSHPAKTSRPDNSKRSIFKPGAVCWSVGGA